MYLLLNMLLVHYHVSLLEGNTYSGLETSSSERTQFGPVSKVQKVVVLIEFSSWNHKLQQTHLSPCDTP